MAYLSAVIQAPAATTWLVTAGGFSFVADVLVSGYADSTGLPAVQRGSQVAHGTGVGGGPYGDNNVLPLVTANTTGIIGTAGGGGGASTVNKLQHGVLNTVVLQDIDLLSPLPHLSLADYARKTFGVRFHNIGEITPITIGLNFGFGENSYNVPGLTYRLVWGTAPGVYTAGSLGPFAINTSGVLETPQSFVATGLTPNTTYYLRMEALDSALRPVTYSNEVVVTTLPAASVWVSKGSSSLFNGPGSTGNNVSIIGTTFAIDSISVHNDTAGPVTFNFQDLQPTGFNIPFPRTWSRNNPVGFSAVPPLPLNGTGDIIAPGITLQAGVVLSFATTGFYPTVNGMYQNVASVSGGAASTSRGRRLNYFAGGSAPNLGISKTIAAGPYNAGVPIVTTLTVTNTGTATAGGALLLDPIPVTPPGTTRVYTSVVTGGATGNTASGVGAINDSLTVPVGATVVYTITDTPGVAGSYSNSATINGGSPAVTVPVAVGPALAPNITTSKTTPAGPYPVGSPIISTLVISNIGTGTGFGINVNDPIPAPAAGTTRSFTSFATGGATGNTPAGTTAINNSLTMPVGSVVTYTISDTPNSAHGTYQNCVTVSPGNVTCGASGFVIPAVPLSAACHGNVILTQGVPIVPVFQAILGSGGQLPYTYSADINLPAGLVLNTLTGELVGTPTTIQGPIPVIFTVTDSQTPGFFFFNCALTFTIVAPGPQIITDVKVTAGGPYFTGVPIVSTLTVSNIGASTGPTVSVLDPIPVAPPGTTRVFSSVATGGATGNAPTGVSGINDTLTIPAGGQVVYTITDTPTQPGTYQNIATVNGVPTTGGPPTAVSASVTITKVTFGPAVRTIGVPILSDVTISNTSPGSQSGVGVSDPLPAGVTRTWTVTTTGPAVSPVYPASGVGAILFTGRIFPAGSTVTFHITDITTLAAGYVNSASLTGPVPATVSGQTVTVSAATFPILTLTKVTAGAPNRFVGDVIVSTATVGNVGTAPATGVAFADISSGTATVSRVWTSVMSGGATGSAGAGIGNILEALNIPPGGSVVYTVSDTVLTAGSYQNDAFADALSSSGGGVSILDFSGCNPATLITDTTATLNGTVSTLSIATNKSRFRWGTVSGGPYPNTTPLQSIAPGGSYSAAVTGLPAGVPIFFVTEITDVTGTTILFTQGIETECSFATLVSANVTATKIGSAAPVNVGVPIVSTLTVANSGGVTSTGVIVSDPLPANTSRTWTAVVAGGTTGGALSGVGAILETITLPPGASKVYTITDTVSVAGNYQNIATITPPVGPPIVVTGPGPIIVSNPAISDPQITKNTLGGSPRVPGDTIISVIVLSNLAPAATLPYTGSFLDPIPANVTSRTYTSVATGGSTGNTVAGAGAIADIVTMPVNGTITYTISDIVTNPGTYQNLATLETRPTVGGAVIVISSPIPPSGMSALGCCATCGSATCSGCTSSNTEFDVRTVTEAFCIAGATWYRHQTITTNNTSGNDMLVQTSWDNGTVSQVAQPPGAIVAGTCAAAGEFDTVVLCDPVTFLPIFVVITYTLGVPSAIAYNSNGTVYAGAINSLVQCPDATITSDPEQMCDGGTTNFLRHYVTNNGVPTGVFFDTTLTGVAYIPVGVVTFGGCTSDRAYTPRLSGDLAAPAFALVPLGVLRSWSIVVKTGTIVLTSGPDAGVVLGVGTYSFTPPTVNGSNGFLSFNPSFTATGTYRVAWVEG